MQRADVRLQTNPPPHVEMSTYAIMAQHILVTGGTGYIGSHTVVLLVEAGYRETPACVSHDAASS